jgi:hypothetical protein
VFQKELYNFESLYKFIQRTCTVVLRGLGICLPSIFKKLVLEKMKYTNNNNTIKFNVIFYKHRVSRITNELATKI